MRTLLGLLIFGCCIVSAPAQDAMPTVTSGFTIERIGTVDGARELAVAPNGDLFVGTLGNAVDLLPQAQSDHPGTPHAFATFDYHPAAGVTLGDGALFVGTQFAVYRIEYHTGDQTARGAPVKLLDVRLAGGSHDHVTTSVAIVDDILYASVGSSCNACRPELDSTRATIQRFDLLRHVATDEAYNIRNAIALTVNPATQTLWAGVAGADDLPLYHPMRSSTRSHCTGNRSTTAGRRATRIRNTSRSGAAIVQRRRFRAWSFPPTRHRSARSFIRSINAARTHSPGRIAAARS
jgi:hypothetical protein